MVSCLGMLPGRYDRQGPPENQRPATAACLTASATAGGVAGFIIILRIFQCRV